MSLLFAFGLAHLLGCAFGAFLMKRFGLTTIKEKIVEVERISPGLREFLAQIDRHRKEKHGASFSDCQHIDCWRSRVHLEAERRGTKLPINVSSEAAPDFARLAPPSITAILREGDGVLPIFEGRRKHHAST